MKLENFNSILDIRKWWKDNGEPREMTMSSQNYQKLKGLLVPFQQEEIDKKGAWGEIIINIEK